MEWHSIVQVRRCKSHIWWTASEICHLHWHGENHEIWRHYNQIQQSKAHYHTKYPNMSRICSNDLEKSILRGWLAPDISPQPYYGTETQLAATEEESATPSTNTNLRAARLCGWILVQCSNRGSNNGHIDIENRFETGKTNTNSANWNCTIATKC